MYYDLSTEKWEDLLTKLKLVSLVIEILQYDLVMKEQVIQFLAGYNSVQQISEMDKLLQCSPYKPSDS